MRFCAKCGEELPEGAEFCPKCGARVAALVKAERKDYSGAGGVLILIGGVLAIAFSIFFLTFTPFWRMMMGMRGIWGGWPFPWARFAVTFMAVRALVSIILGAVAIYAYNKARKGEFKGGGLIAIVTAVIMLITMSWLPGILTLIGGILCYASE